MAQLYFEGEPISEHNARQLPVLRKSEIFELAKEAKKHIFRGVVRNGNLTLYGFITNRGTYALHNVDVCYGGMRGYVNNTYLGAQLVYMLDWNLSHRALNRTAPTEDEYNYIDWCLNWSYWKDPFLIKDAQEVWETGGIIDMAYPAQWCISATSTIREMCEFGNIETNFNRFTELLGDEHAAYFMLHLIQKYKDKWVYSPLTGHVCFEVLSFSRDRVRNYFKGYTLPFTERFDENLNYYDRDDVWGARRTAGERLPGVSFYGPNRNNDYVAGNKTGNPWSHGPSPLEENQVIEYMKHIKEWAGI